MALMNPPDSLVPYFFPKLIASLITTFLGVSVYFNSYVDRRKILLSMMPNLSIDQFLEYSEIFSFIAARLSYIPVI